MSGAGRGVTPGAESEAGQGESAVSPGPGRDRAASADHRAEAPDPGRTEARTKAAEEEVSEAPEDGDDGDAARGPGSRRSSGTRGDSGSGGGALASDEALAALRDKLSGQS